MVDRISTHPRECEAADTRGQRERRAAEGNKRDRRERGAHHRHEARSATYRHLDGIPGTERRKRFLHRVPGHLLPVQQLDDVCGPVRGGVGRGGTEVGWDG